MVKKKDFLKIADAAVSTVFSGIEVVKRYCSRSSDGPIAIRPSSTFTYVGTSDKAEYRLPVCYRDEYFEGSSCIRNDSLATTSLSFAMSCGNSARGYGQGYANAQEVLSANGFENIVHNGAYQEKPSMDTIGVIIGMKRLKDSTLVFIGLRGMGYGAEWGGNLLIGTGKYHLGFDMASDKALHFLSEYIRSGPLKGRIKLWVTGYSRSASTANLVAGKIDNAIVSESIVQIIGDRVTLVREDLFAYCFEPAETVMSDAYPIHGRDYANIWNYVNPNDPVPIMVTACFGMGRFGNDVPLPDCSDRDYTELRDRMLRFYNGLPNRESLGQYRTDFFSALDLSNLYSENREVGIRKTQSEFLTEFNGRFTEYVESRDFYAENIQGGLSRIIANRSNDDNPDGFLEVFRRTLGENKTLLAASLLHVVSGDEEGLRKSLRRPVSETMDKMGIEQSLCDDMCGSISEMLFVFKDFIRDNRSMTFHFLINLKTIFFAHYPELILSWLMSYDSHYLPPVGS